MSRKIIGVTVGTQLPKPNFKQTDPTKGDYIKNKPDFEGLKSRVDEMDALVGDKKVSEQISEAVATKSDVGHTHDYIAISAKGAAGGVAELDVNGKVLSAQLPSYVDDVVEASSKSAFPATGESGKIYIAIDTNKTYRWSGSAYTEISSSLALGETASTAYRGDRGAAAYTHSQVTSGNPHKVTKSDLGLGNVENKSSSTIRSELTQDNITTALGYTPAKTDVATTSTNGLMSSTDKVALHNLGTLVGDTKVSDQISNAISKIDYPVDSVNGKTGEIQLTAKDVGAMTVGEANSLFSEKADTIQHKTGNIISANNSAHTPIKGLNLYGKTTQNGTPTPDAPVPLETVGADGNVDVRIANSNLMPFPYQDIDGATTNGLTFNVKPDGSVVVNGTATAEAFFSFSSASGKQLYLPKGKYTFSGVPDGTYGGSLRPQLWVRNTDNTVKFAVYAEGKIVEITKPDYFAVSIDIVKGNVLNNFVVKPMINVGATALPFESPIERQTLTVQTPTGLPGIPVSSGGNYTDENGQMWICDEIDFARGKYVQRVSKLSLPISEMNNTEDYPGWKNVPAIKENLTYRNHNIPESVSALCNIGLSNGAKSIGINNVNGNGILFFYISVWGMTQSQWKEQYPNLTVEMLLSMDAPIETDLTAEEIAQYSALHTNYPNTTIYNDEGAGMEVVYYTPSTAVQMVHSPADEGKMLTIDEHGCVVLGDNTLTNFGITANAQELNYVTGVKENVQTQIDEISATFNNLVGDTSVSEQIETTISNMEDLVFADEEDFATSASPLNADTLGGRPASDFALVSELTTRAPAGYGLGSFPNSYEYSQIDTLMLPGWYRVNVKNTINGVYVNVAHMMVSAVNEYNVIQTLYTTTFPYVVLIRQNYSGSWYPWECDNPPMIHGVEYRTTERYNGKPVYIKLVNFGNLPNNNWKDIATDIPNTAGFVDISLREKFEDGGMGYNPNITIYLSHQNKKSDVYKIFVLTTSDESANTADVVIKYTKD